MAKLSKETLDAGRELIRNKNLDGFMAWLDDNNIVISRAVTRNTYSRLFLADATDRALKMFDEIFPAMNPTIDIAGELGKLALKGLGIAASIGGLLYLIRKMTGK